MKIFTKILALLLVLTTLMTYVASCTPRVPDNAGDDVIVTPGDNGGNNSESGSNSSTVIIESASAPYIADVHVSASVTPDENNQVPSEGVNLDSSLASATVPGGVQLEDGASEVALTVNGIDESKADVALSETEIASSLDVHVAGVASENSVPMEITLYAAATKGLNSTSIKLYHVENGETVEMTLVGSDEEFTAHNQFKYDPATGNVTLYIASFSEILLVSDTENEWTGGVDHTWYDATATELTIANADQLWSFSQIVGGMAEGIDQDSFSGKTVTLLADINLGDKDNANPDVIFYPIGYNSNDGKYEKTGVAVSTGFYTFNGTFDGNGHTISNFYQNTWEMKGDHNWYDATLQYYRDGMGLFGKLYGATVKNLTVSDFSSDGEIATTGVIAAYADGATFKNIQVFNCNPRVYNIGNGGIVGCVGWYAKEAGMTTTFENITVDNSNKISALWGSYDVACGGIVGQYYPTSGQSSANGGISFTNCHVSAQMDVYNDVCANYQYYAYRYTGMMIGSVRENEELDGRVYPQMDGITASGCTVHFGDWNDYYYCELVANTTASYTHDHQMSRLTQVASVNVENKTITTLDGETVAIPTSGRANYVVVSGEHATENATCYHFVDGEVWSHKENGGYEEKDIDGDGVIDSDVLKEDKQHLYLEFNNLFTGYGWGVTSYGINNLDGINNMDIILAEGLPEGAIEKFESTEALEFKTGSTVNINEIFKAIENSGVEINNKSIIVSTNSVSDSTAKATWYAGSKWEDGYESGTWEDGYLVLEGVGKLDVTITDYHLCKPTTVTIDVQPIDKFEKKFTNTNFTYRIGNQSSITLGSLFGAIENLNVPVDSSSVEISANDCTFTKNSSDWTKAILSFSGFVGEATIEIKDATSNPCSVTVDVINAVNATTSTNATANNVVLLNDCNFSSLEVSDGYTLFGNGFTMTCASDSYALDMGYAFVTLDSGTLDNVQIVCPNFDYAALYKSNLTSEDNRSYTDANGTIRYYNAKSGVMVSGNSQILNSRVSGGRAAVNITGGNVIIDNSQIELGAVASLLIGSANSVTLKDIVLIQEPTESTYKADGSEVGTTLMGLSVLFLCDSDGEAAPTTLKGTLTQYAWANENHADYAPSGTDGIITAALAKENCTHDINDSTYINLGFAYMPSDTTTINSPTNINDERTNSDEIPYSMEDVKAKVSAVIGTTEITAYVYTYINENGTDSSFTTKTSFVPNKYSDIIEIGYSDTQEGLTSTKSFSSEGWIYELNVDLDTLSNYSLDFSKLYMTVNGVIVTDYTVNGAAKPSSAIDVVAGGTTYTLTATINDIEYNTTFKVIGTETSKDAPSIIAANYNESILVGEKTITETTWSSAAPALVGIQIRYWSVSEKQYKTITLSDYTPTTTGKQNGTNASWTYTESSEDFTLTITNTTAVHSGNSIYAMPVVVNNALYFVITSSNGLVSTSSGARAITLKYEFSDNNGQKLEFTNTFNATYDSSATLYDYSEFCDGSLTEASSGGCVSPDTLVTLADGTQKEIQYVTYEDMLLVWNHFTGNYESVPAAIIFNHGYDYNTVIKLNFSDGTQVKVINLHQFFDADLNRYVSIDAGSVANYVGHEFVKQDGNSYTTVTLESYEISNEYIEAYGIISALHYNILVEGMLSTDFMLEDYDLFNYFAFGEGLAFDSEMMQSDIEKYGLYTYKDFANYLTYEQFIGFNVQYFKIAVGKGLYTYEGILNLIDEYLH